jgi:hypothetical protein
MVVVSALNHDDADDDEDVLVDNKKLEGELLRLQDEPALEVATHPFPNSNNANTSVALHNAAIIAELEPEMPPAQKERDQDCCQD